VSPPYDHRRAIVLWLGFVQFCTWVANEKKYARCKCKVTDSVLVLALELLCQHKTTLEDVVIDGSEVILALLELLGMCGNEVVSGEWFNKVRDKECC
jgi:hypothetical protein